LIGNGNMLTGICLPGSVSNEVAAIECRVKGFFSFVIPKVREHLCLSRRPKQKKRLFIDMVVT